MGQHFSHRWHDDYITEFLKIARPAQHFVTASLDYYYFILSLLQLEYWTGRVPYLVWVLATEGTCAGLMTEDSKTVVSIGHFSNSSPAFLAVELIVIYCYCTNEKETTHDPHSNQPHWFFCIQFLARLLLRADDLSVHQMLYFVKRCRFIILLFVGESTVSSDKK